MMQPNLSIIVPGSLNTDIIGLGVDTLLKPGELTFSGELKVGPGGKSRNIAQMIAAILEEENRVAMLGRSVRDPFHFGEIPIKALQENGVNTDYIKVFEYTEKQKFPGIALIPVDKFGNNQIYVLPGINAEFCPADLEEAQPLFETAQKNNGFLVLTLEMPIETALHAIDMAKKFSLKVILDPGGINPSTNHKNIFSDKLFLVKPNSHEAEIITGTKISNFQSAHEAADWFFAKGIENVLITHGEHGGYFFNHQVCYHILPPQAHHSKVYDETGCGDQTMAALTAYLFRGMETFEAARMAIIAGTLQFYRAGISPVTTSDIESSLLVKHV